MPIIIRIAYAITTFHVSKNIYTDLNNSCTELQILTLKTPIRFKSLKLSIICNKINLKLHKVAADSLNRNATFLCLIKFFEEISLFLFHHCRLIPSDFQMSCRYGIALPYVLIVTVIEIIIIFFCRSWNLR